MNATAIIAGGVNARASELATDLALLSTALEQIAHRKRERELATDVYAALLDDEIAALSERIVWLRKAVGE